MNSLVMILLEDLINVPTVEEPGLDINACLGQVATSVGQVHNSGHRTSSCRCNI